VVEKMDPFEQELREQLQARSAPGGFADRVMARVPHGRAPRETFLGFGLGFRQPVWRWGRGRRAGGGDGARGLEHGPQQRLAGERARNKCCWRCGSPDRRCGMCSRRSARATSGKALVRRAPVREKDDQ